MARDSNAGSRGSGGPLIVAALILGAAIVGGSLLVRSALQSETAELANVRTALTELHEAVQAGAAPKPTRQAARPDRPDPNKRYEIDVEGSPSLGPESSKVTIVEFSDFQCPFCARVVPTIKKVEEEYGDQVRVVFKHLPLNIHPKAPAAHAAAEAAHRQGKFWEMHDKIFANQREMSPEKYVEYARELGLDVERFQKDVADPEVKRRVDADARQAASLLVRGTPGFFINGRYISGAQPFAVFKARIDEELGEG